MILRLQREQDPVAGELYFAGERVPAGIYKNTESGRQVCLTQEDFLPASMDGRVACYTRLRFTWSQIQHHEKAA